MNANDASMIEANTMYLTDLFQKCDKICSSAASFPPENHFAGLVLTSSCMEKCIAPSYHEEALAKGEANCIDRCVVKYMDVHKIVEQKMMEQQQQQADAAMQQ